MKATKFKSSELGSIPVDWEVKRIGEVGKLMRDSVNTQVFPDQTYYEYSMPNYDDGRIPRVVLGRSLFSNKTSIQGEVLLFNKLNVRKRRIWYVKEVLPNAICSSEFLPYYSKEIDLCFLSYFLSTDKCTSAFEDYSTGTSNSQKRIAPLDFENYTIPLPPIAEQRRIAGALSDVDELISALGKLIEKKRNIKTGAMQQLLTGKTRLPGFGARRAEFKQTELGLIPVDWEMKRLGDLASIARGGSPRPIEAYLSTDINAVNWIKIGDVGPDAKYITETKERIIRDGISKSRMVYPGDFLLSNSMSFGRPYITRIAGCIHDGWLVIQNYQECYDTEFLYYILGSDTVSCQYITMAAGSSVQNLNKDVVAGVITPIPPLAEQKAIAAVLSDMDAEIAALEADRAKYERIKSGMMQELLTGKTRLRGK